MSDKTYNGWSNYETWAVNLWLTNEQGSDEQLRSIVRESKDSNGAAQSIKEWVTDEYIPDLGASLAADLLGAAMSEVDWYEIAENHADAREKVEEDGEEETVTP